MNRPLTPYLLSLPAAGLLLTMLASPLLLLLRMSLHRGGQGRVFYVPGTWTLDSYHDVTDAYGLRMLGYTVLFGAGVAVLTVAAGYATALWLRDRTPRRRRLVLAVVLAPKLASVLVVLFGLQLLLADTGPLNRLLQAAQLSDGPVRLLRGPVGAVVGESALIFPYSILILYTHLTTIDPTFEAAARGLGASAWQRFRRITLPLSAPGLALAGELALVWGMGAFLGPLLLGGPAETTLSVEVHRQAFDHSRWPRAAAEAVLLTLTVLACLAAYGGAVRRWRRRT